MTYDGEGEACFVEVGVVDQACAETEDDERDEHGKTAEHHDPDGCPEDVIRHALFILWCLHREVLFVVVTQGQEISCKWKSKWA